MFNCKAASPKVPCPLYKSRITLANTGYCIFNGDVFRSIRLTVDWPKQAAWRTLTLGLMAEKHLKEACVTECCPWGLQTLTVFHDKLLTLRGEWTQWHTNMWTKRLLLGLRANETRGYYLALTVSCRYLYFSFFSFLRFSYFVRVQRVSSCSLSVAIWSLNNVESSFSQANIKWALLQEKFSVPIIMQKVIMQTA